MTASGRNKHIILIALFLGVLLPASFLYVFLMVSEARTGLIEVRALYEMEIENSNPPSSLSRAILFLKTYERHYWELLHYAEGRGRKIAIVSLAQTTVLMAFAWLIALGLVQGRDWGFKGAILIGVLLALAGLSIWDNTILLPIIIKPEPAIRGVYNSVTAGGILFAWGTAIIFFALGASQPGTGAEDPDPSDEAPAAR